MIGNRMTRTMGLRRLSGAVVALAMAAACARSGDVEKDAAATMRRGLDWLKATQNEDGSWSNPNYPAMTALGLLAFTRGDHPSRSEVCARAAAFIARFAQADGGIYKPASGGRGSGGLSTYNTAICMIALHAYDAAAYTPILLKARDFMAGSQLRGGSDGAGGFGYDRPEVPAADGAAARRGPPNRADLSNTGWSLMAMRQTQALEDLRPAGAARAELDWSAALTFVDRLQSRDEGDTENYGGFAYEAGGERGEAATAADGTVKLRGFGSMTYAGLESMIYAQVNRTDPRVRSALAWAARHWSVDENPGMGQKGLFYYYTIMAKALSLSGSDTLKRPDGKTIAWKQELVTKLGAIQKADGSWINADNQFWEGDATLVTAYAILTLEYALGLP